MRRYMVTDLVADATFCATLVAQGDWGMRFALDGGATIVVDDYNHQDYTLVRL